MHKRCWQRRACAIFLVALILRAGAFIATQPWEESWHARLLYAGDPFEYLTLARSLWERQAFSTTWPVAMPNGFRTPAYPLFLAVLCGGQVSSVWFAVLVQVLLDSAFAVGFANVVQACFQSRNVGFAAGILYACYPEAVFWSTQLFPEQIGVWFASVGLGFIAFAMRLKRKHLEAVLIITGSAVIGLTVIIKPNWILMPIIAAAWLFFKAAHFNRAGRLTLLVSLLLLAAPTLCWMSWNRYAWGNWTVNYGQVAFREAIAAGLIKATSSQETPASAIWSHEMNLHMTIPDFSRVNYLPARNSTVTMWSRDSLSRDKAFVEAQYARLIAENPWTYSKMHFSGAAYLLCSPGSDFMANAFARSNVKPHLYAIFATSGSGFFDLLQQKFLAARINVISLGLAAIVLFYLIICYLGAAVTLLRALLDKTVFSLGGPWLCYLIFFVLNIALIGPGGTSRYRYALFVGLIPYASIFLSKVGRAVQVRFSEPSCTL